MPNIHREYVTPQIICTRGKLDRNMISLLDIYVYIIDSRDLVGIWMFY